MRTQQITDLEKDGYSFTGVYDFFKSKVKERAKELKKDGYFIRVVFEPTSKYTRGGGGGGYSVYSKPTKKKRKELEAEKIAKEKQKMDNLLSITTYLSTRTGAELIELFKEAKGGESGLLRWAKNKNIIK